MKKSNQSRKNLTTFTGHQKSQMEYIEGKTKIKGDPSDVKGLIHFKAIMYEFRWLLIVILSLVVYRATRVGPVVLKWLRDHIITILFVAQVVYLSG